RRVVEWRFELPAEVRLDKGFPIDFGCALELFGKDSEVLGAHGNVANLVVKDSLEDPRAALVSLPIDSVAGARCDVKPARLQNHRYHGKACRDVVSRVFRRLPADA